MKRILKLLAPLPIVLLVATTVLGIPSYADNPQFDLTPRNYLPLVLKSYSEPAATPSPTRIIVDHQQVALFDQIPDSAIANAAALKMMFRHASVGGNINTGLNSLYSQNNKYNRSNWSFQSRGNPGWQQKIDDLVTQAASQATVRDVLSMKFCYVDQDASWSYYRDHMEELMATYPTKKFIWWTMPVMTTGHASRDAFNNNLRAYAQTHDLILFDIAAIESHDPAGNPITNNGYEAMYAGYTSDGGHLNTTGQQRVAKAHWYLMARVAGWS